MSEDQHIEWKESWRDDALRLICGFANADGGAGIGNARRLLEELPNKVSYLTEARKAGKTSESRLELESRIESRLESRLAGRVLSLLREAEVGKAGLAQVLGARETGLTLGCRGA